MAILGCLGTVFLFSWSGAFPSHLHLPSPFYVLLKSRIPQGDGALSPGMGAALGKALGATAELGRAGGGACLQLSLLYSVRA